MNGDSGRKSAGGIRDVLSECLKLVHLESLVKLAAGSVLRVWVL